MPDACPTERHPSDGQLGDFRTPDDPESAHLEQGPCRKHVDLKQHFAKEFQSAAATDEQLDQGSADQPLCKDWPNLELAKRTKTIRTVARPHLSDWLPFAERGKEPKDDRQDYSQQPRPEGHNGLVGEQFIVNRKLKNQSELESQI